MDISYEDDSLSTIHERDRTKLLTLPDELAEWAHQNQELVLRIQNALTDTYETLSDDQLWEVIAAASSPEWVEARKKFHAAEEVWEELNNPHNAPLGSIGSALDSEETNHALDRFTISLADFTIINEGLRQREDLRRLLDVLMVQKRMLEHSAEQTRQLLKTAKTLPDPLMEDFEEAAHRHNDSPVFSIVGLFRRLAAKRQTARASTKPALSSNT